MMNKGKNLKGKGVQDEEVLLFKLYEKSTQLDNTKSRQY